MITTLPTHGSKSITTHCETERHAVGRRTEEFTPGIDPKTLNELDGLYEGDTSLDDDWDDVVEDFGEVGEFPEHLLHPGGMMQEFIEYVDANSRKHQPILNLAASVALMATVTGRKIRDEGGTRPNIYILGTAPASGGKEAAREGIKRVLWLSGAGKKFLMENPASDVGIVNHLADVSPAGIIIWDEIGRYLGATQKNNAASHLLRIPTVLTRLFTSSGSLFVGDAKAKVEETRRISCPCLVIYGCTVPHALYQGLSTETLTDGFMNRMLVFQTPEKRGRARRRLRETHPPDHLLEAVAAWNEFEPDETGIPIPHSTDAESVYDEWMDDWEDRMDSAPDHIAGMLGRNAEKANKLALLHHASLHRTPGGMLTSSNGVVEPSVGISGESMRWACELTDFLTDRLLEACDDWMASNPTQANVKAIQRIIDRGGEKGATLRDIYRGTNHLTDQQRETSFNTIEGSGSARYFRIPGKGAKRLAYVGQKFKAVWDEYKPVERAE